MDEKIDLQSCAPDFLEIGQSCRYPAGDRTVVEDWSGKIYRVDVACDIWTRVS